MIRAPKFLVAVLASQAGAVAGVAQPCENHLRTNDYREAPQLGQAKVGMVDYKLLNQLLMALQRAVVDGHPRPDGFEAELKKSSRQDAPVGGIVLKGVILWPEHPLEGHLVELELQRERLAITAELRDLTSGKAFIAVMDDEGFGSVFPFQPPSGRGLLLSLGKGLQLNVSRFSQTSAGD